MVKRKLIIILAIIGLIVAGILYEFIQDPSSEIVLEGDLNDNGMPEKYAHKNFRLKVYEDDKILWESPAEYKIDHVAIGDVTGDGRGNLLICVWKKGSFGRYRPFWHHGKDDEYKHHLFIYEYKDGRFKPRWFSSSLLRPITDMELIQNDDVGNQHLKLFVVEGKYKKAPFGKHTVDRKASITQGRSSIWEWDKWGFSLLALPGELDQEYSK